MRLQESHSVVASSKPVQDAVQLIQQVKFSTSARMNRLFTNINKIPLTVKHLSRKFQLSEIAYHQSRNSATCTAVNSSIQIHRWSHRHCRCYSSQVCQHAKGVNVLLPTPCFHHQPPKTKTTEVVIEYLLQKNSKNISFAIISRKDTNKISKSFLNIFLTLKSGRCAYKIFKSFKTFIIC